MKHLIKVLVFCWYLIRFNSDFSSWTIVLKGKIWLTRWSKIQSDQTVGSKSQLFDHTQLGLLVLVAIRGILNIVTLWSTIQSCCIYLLPFFGYETCNLHLFFFFFFEFWHLFWHVNRGWIKYDIDKNEIDKSILIINDSSSFTINLSYLWPFLNDIYICWTCQHLWYV